MKKATGFHKMSLAALFTVGITLIRYPWRESPEELLSAFAVSFLGALIPAFFLYPMFQKFYRQKFSQNQGVKILGVLLSLFFLLYASVCFYDSSKEYIGLLQGLILSGINKFGVAVLFLLCSLSVALLPRKGLDSLAILSFLIVLLSVFALFFIGRNLYVQKNEFLTLPSNFSPLSKEILNLWKESLLPLSVLSLYFALSIPKGGERALALGTLVGYGLLLVCVIQTLLVFGQAYAASLKYPYAYAIRVISVGPYFFRLEGISYVVDFLGALFRAGVSLACIKRLCARFFPRLARGCAATVSVLCLTVLVFTI